MELSFFFFRFFPRPLGAPAQDIYNNPPENTIAGGRFLPEINTVTIGVSAKIQFSPD
jgi:hypothetical protein